MTNIADVCVAFAGVVMSKLGADVVASDLEPNLPLVQDNMSGNGEYTMPSIH